MRRTFVAAGPGLTEFSESVPPNPSTDSAGGGVYTTLRTFGPRRVVRLAQHVARLNQSAVLLGRKPGLELGEALRCIARALDATRHAESRLRLTWTAPRLVIDVEPFTPLAPVLYSAGVRCATLGVRRENPAAKDSRFLATARDAYAHLPHGVHEGLLLSHDREILEGLSSNFFALTKGRLHTEGPRALEGVTRSMTLELARQRGPVELSAPRLDDVPLFEEAFLTSVSRGILPVVEIDGTRVGVGSPGPVTQALRQAFDDLVEREGEPVV